MSERYSATGEAGWGHHLTYDHYLAVLEGKLPAGLLQQLAEHHLQEACPSCRAAWEAAATGSSRSRAMLTFGETYPGQAVDERAVCRADIERCEQALSEARQAAREARTDLARLLALAPEAWPGRVENARTRMRSRAFAGLLIEESRRRVRVAPHQAATLASLVKTALDRREGRLAQPWARRLLARALAHRGNALRVAGDLPQAEACFSELRTRFAGELTRPEICAEASSLEGSLRIDQRRWQEAEDVLQEAAAGYRQAGNADGEVRSLIQRLNLASIQSRPRHVLHLLASLAKLEAAVVRRYRPSLLVVEAMALCDLGRPSAARDVLDAEGALLVEDGDPRLVASYRTLRGRVELGLGDPDAAVEHHDVARETLLEIDRDYDAILASLDLADALLAAGRSAEAGHLARDLVPLFRSRGVARETLASLRLLAEAARQEAVTAALLAEVRERLTEAAS